MGKPKWGKEGPDAGDFGWIVMNFIGMLIVKILGFLVVRAAFRYCRSNFASWKQRGEKKKPVVDPSDFDGEEDQDHQTVLEAPSPRHDRGTTSFASTIKSEDIQNDLKKWVEKYNSESKSKTNAGGVKVEDGSLAAGKRLLEKIRERQKAKKEKIARQKLFSFIS